MKSPALMPGEKGSPIGMPGGNPVGVFKVTAFLTIVNLPPLFFDFNKIALVFQTPRYLQSYYADGSPICQYDRGIIG
jgi:hypothetical protein